MHRTTERRGGVVPSVRVFLLPAVVGGGLGDIDEVLTAGWYLSRKKLPVALFRGPGRPFPPGTTGPWDWPKHQRLTHLGRSSEWALTVSAGWGVVAAPARPEPYGRAGPWSEEAREIERLYGPERTIHVSFEEFARTLTSREQTVERWREGGVSQAEIRRRISGKNGASEVATFHREYAKFRGFQRPNVVHLFTTFRFSRPFASEFPHAVQTGPLWPRFPASPPLRQRGLSGDTDWIWYASPSTADRLLPRVLRSLARHTGGLCLWYRTPRGKPPSAAASLRVLNQMQPTKVWRNRFVRARVRIVTGSRTLLEAIQLGAPFLYFNGVTGRGRSARRHRPEKIRSLLSVWKSRGVSAELRRDLDLFSRGRAVDSVVRRASHRVGAWGRFPRFLPVEGFQAPYDSASDLLWALVSRMTAEAPEAASIVREVRSGVLKLSP